MRYSNIQNCMPRIHSRMVKHKQQSEPFHKTSCCEWRRPYSLSGPQILHVTAGECPMGFGVADFPSDTSQHAESATSISSSAGSGGPAAESSSFFSTEGGDHIFASTSSPTKRGAALPATATCQPLSAEAARPPTTSDEDDDRPRSPYDAAPSAFDLEANLGPGACLTLTTPA